MFPLQQLKDFYQSGATLSYDFRKKQLLQLKAALLCFEKEIQQALYDDLRKNAEEVWITETGFVLAEINHALKHLKQWMKPEKRPTNLLNFPSKSYVYKEPLGVVLVIGPWNYPVQLLFTPLVGAIAAGNCALLKPSEHAAATSAVLKKLIEESFDSAYIHLIEGRGDEVVPEMMKEFSFDHVFFTGSTEVGRRIYQQAAEKLIPVTLELGGKNPCVVEADADIEISARRITATKFSNAGQMCVAPDYLLVHQAVEKTFTEAIICCIHQFYSADPASDYHYGKLINEQQLERLKKYLNAGTIIHGGRYDAASHYLEPTLIKNLPLDAAIMGEEIFGPVLPIFTFKDFDEARSIINRNPNPLAFYVFSRSRQKQRQWLNAIHSGSACINNAAWHLTNYHLPFGGRGNSGMGRYHGKYSFDVFSHHKAVMKTPLWFDPKIKFPPFKGRLNLFRKILR